MQVEVWLAEGFVLGLQECEGFEFILGAEAQLLASFGVLAIVGAVALVEGKTLLHNSAES